jgi:3-hydroxyisobutyrate dehydrogenase
MSTALSAVATLKPGAAIAFVGLGLMGLPMAANLARAGYRVHAIDANAQAVTAHQAEFLGSNAPLAECTAAIMMLPNGDIVRMVLLEGDNALARRLPKGALVIDMSSSSPVGTRKLGEDLAAVGLHLIDAPVSGGVKRAIPGTLAIMAGGEVALIEAARPVLEKLGNSLHLTGPIGTAHAMKALNNYVSAAGLMAAAEATIAAQKFGLDPATVVTILNASTGVNNSTQNKFAQFILSRKFNAGFSLGLMAKDLRIALEVIESTGTPDWIARPVVEASNRAEAALGGAEDHTGVVKIWEEAAKAQMGVK